MINYSVVATTYNDENEILNYLENICEQELKPYEIVLVDGGSKDNTVSIIKEFSVTSLIPIKVLSGERLNISQGYNKAIKEATCDFIGVTGVGNWYSKDFFLRLSRPFSTGNVDVTYSPIRGKNSNSFSIKYNNTILHGNSGQRMDIASNHGAIVRRQIFEELGYFYEKFIYAGEDAEFYLLVNNRGYSSVMVDDAELRWYTPLNLKQYYKQVKVYSIATLQIKSNQEIIRRIIKKWFPVLLELTILILYPWLGIILFCTGILIFAIKSMTLLYEKKSPWLWFCDRYLPSIYYVLNCRYMDKKYKVFRSGNI